MRTVSDDDEDEEDDGTGVRLAEGSGYASRAQSSQASSSDLSAMAGDGLDAPIAVESMIVRRRTLNSKSPMVPSGPGSLLKRPGGSLLQSPTTKRYSFAKK
ncbi:hypothetical protein FBU59_005559 [Linderina macrospora]|uniref:Uncharacterized protein n=1 Tax=Linderina macrospora TaxID=4868 RepID=A0ACC1J2F1_9FUNG|nr:hypothetical protein FBU59_005559 [Linderina macrospora]